MIKADFYINQNNSLDLKIDNKYIVLYYHLTYLKDINNIITIYLIPFINYQKGIFVKDETDFYDINVDIGGMNFNENTVEIIFQTSFDDMPEILMLPLDEVQTIFEDWARFINDYKMQNLNNYAIEVQEKLHREDFLLKQYFKIKKNDI